MPSSIIAAVIAEALIAEFVIVNLIATAFIRAATALVVGSIFRALTSSNKKSTPSAATTARGRTISVRQPISAWRILYGRVKTGGVITYIRSDGGSKLDLVVTFAGHECDAIEEIWFGDELVPLDGSGNATGKYAGYAVVKVSLGNISEGQPFPGLITASAGEWTDLHRQTGFTKIWVSLTANPELFLGGVPNIAAVIRGRLVFDPRSSPTARAYSNNTALCVNDYLTDTDFGFGSTFATEIDSTQLVAAANVCDESIAKLSGSEDRYTCNGTFDCDANPQEVLGLMLASMVGKAVNVGGMWFIFAGAYEVPTIDLDEGDIVGSLRIQSMLSRRDNANGVKGLFTDPASFWQPTSFPSISSATYLAQDNAERVWSDIDISAFVTSGTQAQRIAKIKLLQSRQGLSVVAQFRLSAWAAMTGRTVSLTNTKFGWSAKPFEVVESRFTADAKDGTLSVELTLRETAAAIYDWSTDQEQVVDIAPNSQLPNAFVVPGAPTGLVATSGNDDLLSLGEGTILSRVKLAWVATGNPFVRYYEIQYTLAGSPTGWDDAAVLDATRVTAPALFGYILPVIDGTVINIRIRAVTTTGIAGAWGYLYEHLVLGKSAAPTDVTGQAYEHLTAGTRIYWNAVADLDLREYVVRSGASWGAGVEVYRGQVPEFTHPLLPTGTTQFWVKAYDTSGNESATAPNVSVVVVAPPVVNMQAVIVGENYQLTWLPVQGSYPVKFYDIRRGSGFVGATRISEHDGTAYASKITWPAGTQTFWVAAVDVAGNYGSEVSKPIELLVPAAPTVSSAIVGETAVISWVAAALPEFGSPAALAGLPVVKFLVRYGSTFETGTDVGEVLGDQMVVPVHWLDDRLFWVGGVDTAGNVGVGGSALVDITAYGAPVISHEIIQLKAEISWIEPVGGNLPIRHYELRWLTNGGGSPDGAWSDATFYIQTSTKKIRIPIDWTGARRFYVAAIDTAGNLGAVTSYETVTIGAPAAPEVTAALSDDSYELTWVPGASDLPLEEYEIRYGVSWYDVGVTVVGRVKGTAFSGVANWGGSRTFLVAAIDLNGNIGAADGATINVSVPLIADPISAQVVDNNVLLSWGDLTASLPLRHHEVYRGDAFATATFIGTVGGRFSAVFEQSSGLYSYWIRGVDIAGNFGPENKVTTLVSQPPDFVLYDQQDSQLDSTNSDNCITVGPQYAIQLNGSTQYGSVTSIPDLDSGITGLTMECWFMAPSLVPTSGLMEKTIGGAVNTCALLYCEANGQLYARVNDGALKNATYSIPSARAGSWIHAILRWDAANGVQLAVDGVNQATTAAASLSQGAGALNLGQLGTGAPSYSLNGQLGPSRVYKRRITDTEILEHYRGVYKDNTSLVASWNMTRGSGVLVNDDTDNSNDLNLFSTPTWIETTLDGRIDPTETKGLYYPVNAEETFAEHFELLGSPTPLSFQDMINQGYAYWLSTPETAAQYVEVIDYGTTIPSTKINVALTNTALLGAVTVVPTISTSNTGISGSPSPWTDYVGVYSIFATNFRWIKITLDITTAGGNHFQRTTKIQTVLSVKLRKDSGFANCLSTDDDGVSPSSPGTVVEFNVDFIDVRSIQVTPNSATPVGATYVFVDVQNPTQFQILLHDPLTGDRVSGNASWTADGV